MSLCKELSLQLLNIGMASLLPGKELVVDDKGQILLVDGMKYPGDSK
ncbi:MAG: hypothetical protein ACOX4H_07505 [Bacillota bacterium]